MDFVRTWLTPRIAFWVKWTAWLSCLSYFVLDRIASLGPFGLLLVVGPPLVITWIGSRFVRNPFDTPSSLFWKGAAASFALGLFASFFLMDVMVPGFEVLFVGFILCGLIAVMGGGSKRIEIKQGDLFARVQAIAHQTGVSVNRVYVFTSPRNSPGAFAHRLGAILLSDRLINILSRQEVDAVIAHEAAHLRPRQRVFVTALPLLAAFAVIGSQFYPNIRNSAPFWPFAGVMLWRALRRNQEFDADAAATRTTRDPESLITALTRVSIAGGMPLHWGRFAGLFIGHPPMTARFRSIARHGGISTARVDELVAIASAVPALPGYSSPFQQPEENVGVALSTHIDRLTKRLTLLGWSLPILAGIAIPVLDHIWPQDSLGVLTLAVLWTVAAILLYWIVYEITVGSERQRLRSQLPDAYRPDSHFAGLSDSAEPQSFAGTYHYDLGMVSLSEGSLHFKGARCSFSIGRSQVRRVWLGDGPSHWTPRKIVCVEYQSSDDGKTAVISLQSLERWFWPGTSRAAWRLLQALTRWSESGVPETAAAVPPPAMNGTPMPSLRLASFWKPIRTCCLITFGISWVIGSFWMSVFEIGGFVGVLAAPLVTLALLLFGIAPRLESNRKNRPALSQSPPNQTSANQASAQSTS